MFIIIKIKNFNCYRKNAILALKKIVNFIRQGTKGKKKNLNFNKIMPW